MVSKFGRHTRKRVGGLRACQFPFPVEVEYGKAKRAAKDINYTGWGKHG